jgi:thioredoxin reductase (NADPH)
VPREEELIGRGVHFCATCNAPLYQGEELVGVGGGNTAAEEGLFLTKFAPKVTLLVRGDELKASKVLLEKIRSHPKIDVVYNTVVKEFQGDKMLTGVVVENTTTGDESTLHPAGAFIFIGMVPNSQFARDPLRLDDAGFITTDRTLETSVPGVFACGDVRSGSTKQVASAAGEGATAALMIRDYLEHKDDVAQT